MTSPVDAPGALRQLAPATMAEALQPLANGGQLVIEAMLVGLRFSALCRDGSITVFDEAGVDVSADHTDIVDSLAGIDGTDYLIEGVETPDGTWLTDLHAHDGVDWSARPLGERLAQLGEISPVKLMPERTTVEIALVAQAFLRHLRERGFVGAVVRDPSTPLTADAPWGVQVTWL